MEKAPPSAQRQLVLVKWVDSFRDCGWDSIEEKLRDDHSSGSCVSVGWILENSKDWLGITSSMSGEDSCSCMVRIPKVAIEMVSKLIWGGEYEMPKL